MSFPLATEEEAKIGWVLSYKYLESVQDKAEELSGYRIGMEEVEAVLLAVLLALQEME